MNLLEKSKQYALKCHNGTNHEYDGLPYEVHLKMVVDTANEFIHLIPEEERENVLSACWLHDVIEDCRQTYNDVKAETNTTIAEIAYALTNEKGKTRKERACGRYYHGIRETPFAVFVKLCDRIANYTYSKRRNSSMVKKYDDEMDEFISHMHLEYDDPYNILITKLVQLHNWKKIP